MSVFKGSDIVEFAIRIEENGENFYRYAVQLAKDEDTKKIFLNLAEGTGRMSEADKKHFLTIARGSVYECTAIIDLLKSTNQIDDEFFTELYATYEQMSKMLLGMYRSYSK